MKRYEVVPQAWNKAGTDMESNYYDAVFFDTYCDAVSHARSVSRNNAGALINFYRVDRSRFSDAQSYQDEVDCNIGEHVVWGEAYRNGRQVPAVFISGTPIWRWDFQEKDLKPHKKN